MLELILMYASKENKKGMTAVRTGVPRLFVLVRMAGAFPSKARP